jgi:hypothetical protein
VRGRTAPEGTQMSSNKGPDRSAEGMAEGEHPEPSRRSVLHGAAGLAGAGLATVMAGTLAAPASASAAPRTHPGRAARVSSSDEPVIVHVRDVRSGEMDVYAGENQVKLRDPGLAAKLTNAVR